MLAKIGIENFCDKNFDMYSSFSYDFNIVLENILLQNIQKIVSVMVSPTVEHLEIKKQEFEVWINLEVKAVFSLDNGKLSLIQEFLKFYRKIKIEKSFEGMNLEELYSEKRLAYELIVLNFESTMMKNKELRINSLLAITVNCVKDYSVAIVKGELENYLIVLFDDGERIKTIEENIDNKIQDVKWNKNRSFIFYKIQKRICNIVRYNIKNEKKDLILMGFAEIYSFDCVNENLICIEGSKDGIRGIYLYNFIDRNLEILIESDTDLTVEKIKYIDRFERVYFIRVEGQTKSICSMDFDGSSFSEHLEIETEDFYFSKEHNIFFILGEKEINLYDENWGELRKVFYPNISLNQILGTDVGRGKYLFSILSKEGMKNSIYLYDFLENKFVNINFSGINPKIDEIRFNSNGDFLIVSRKGLRENNLYKLTFNGEMKELFATQTKKLKIYSK